MIVNQLTVLAQPNKLYNLSHELDTAELSPLPDMRGALLARAAIFCSPKPHIHCTCYSRSDWFSYTINMFIFTRGFCLHHWSIGLGLELGSGLWLGLGSGLGLGLSQD